MKEKLSHPDWEFQLSMSDGSSSLLVVENPIQFRKTVVGMLNQSKGEDGEFVFSDEKKQFELQDRLIVILDSLNLDPSNKRITTSVNQQIKEIISSSDFFKEANELVMHMERFAESVGDSYRLNLFHKDYEIADLYKILNLQIQVEYEDELERIMEFMNVFHDVCGIDCFVFVSLFCFFSQEEMNTLVREATANKHNLLFIEGHEPDYVPEQTRKIIIDKDSCQIF